jgi:hypothetical protein
MRLVVFRIRTRSPSASSYLLPSVARKGAARELDYGSDNLPIVSRYGALAAPLHLGTCAAG